MTSLDAVLVKAEDVKRRFFFCTIKERNGEYEYHIPFLMVCEAGEDEDKKLDDIVLNWRGDGEREEGSDAVWFDGCITADIHDCKEIPASDYAVMHKYLSVVDGGG